jgi:hypothetical protein
VPITLDNAWVVEYRAGPSGVLRFGAGRIAAGFRFVVKHRTESEGRITVACQVRLADREGRLWQAESVFTPAVLLEKLIDLSRRQAPLWLESAPDEWQQPCKRQVLLPGVGDAYDDRGHHWFYFDGTAFYFRFKHFGISYDIVHLEGTRLLITIDTFGSWAPMPIECAEGLPQAPPPKPVRDEDDEEDVEETGEWLENLDPLVYELDCRELLFHNTAFLNTDGYEMYHESAVPLPVVFQRIKGRGEAQQAVTFQPGRSPGLPAAAGEKASPWMEIGLGNNAGLHQDGIELEVRSGGCLHCSGDRLEMSYRLGLAAGCGSEPVDVLCCELRLADAQGDLWQTQVLFTPEVFLEQMVNLVEDIQPLALSEGEPQWEEASEWFMLLSDVRGVLEGPSRYLLTADQAVAVVGADSSPRFDVAGHGQSLLVRVTGLSGARWPLEIISEEEYAGLEDKARGRSLELGPLPPLYYRLSAGPLLFRNTTFAVDDGFWHRNDLPIPVLFERVEGQGKAQPGVNYRAAGE